MRPIVSDLSSARVPYVHVALPELGIAMHVFPSLGRAEITLSGTLVRMVPFGLA